MTIEELKKRKENAIKLLETHTDEYRLFYAELTNEKEPTPEKIEKFKVKREQLEMKAEAIHTQIRYIDELIGFVEQTEKSSYTETTEE